MVKTLRNPNGSRDIYGMDRVESFTCKYAGQDFDFGWNIVRIEMTCGKRLQK